MNDVLTNWDTATTIVGGIGEARRVCDLAAASYTRIAMHVWGAAPTIMASYHVGFCAPNCFILEVPRDPNPGTHREVP